MIRFKAIVPPKLNITAMNAEIERAARQFGKFALQDVKRITDPWKGEKPEWRIDYVFTRDRVVVTVQPTNPSSKGAQKFVWLDEGTEPHKILPVRAPRLVFMSEYRAGSQPGSLRTFSSARAGDLVFAKQVNHPGIKARNWTELLVKEQEKQFRRWMEPAFFRAARASGHSVS